MRKVTKDSLKKASGNKKRDKKVRTPKVDQPGTLVIPGPEGETPPEEPTKEPDQQAIPTKKEKPTDEAPSFVRECPPIVPFALSMIPPFTKPGTCEDDLALSAFRPSRYTWAGEQRKGISMHIRDATSVADHIDKAMREEFYLSKEIPLPPEIETSLKVVAKYKEKTLVHHWGKQINDLRSLVDDCENIQRIWDAMAPSSIKEATGNMKTVTLAHLAQSLGLGGGNWIRQFTYGFPLVGDLSQSGVYPRKEDLKPAPSIAGIWDNASNRFQERAAHSGMANADTLWKEACEQVKKGWLGTPLPIDTLGNVATYKKGTTNIAFRFGVSQGDKLRACDDLRHNCVNLHCTVWTPIKLPTWDHISQMCLKQRDTRRRWAFFKADHESAYKQLPMAPEHTNLALVALRNPTTGKWVAFPPKALVFGAVSAVLHYNCFSRLISVMFNKIFGIPLLAYFDDFGALVPARLCERALRTFESFCETLGIRLKVAKTELGTRLTFLGLKGNFPRPSNGMTLSIRLPKKKAAAWAMSIAAHASCGKISHADLESVIGRLSFTQTSVFGRIGRAMLSPLYTKLHATHYDQTLDQKELTTLRWWVVALGHMVPRVATPKPTVTERVVYTDAAGKSAIIAAVIFDPVRYTRDKTIDSVWSLKTGYRWKSTFAKTNFIYGLEMLALLALLMDETNDLRDKSVTFYIDNDNALQALVKNTAGPTVIQGMVALIWHRIRDLRITPWFERVPSKRNIADLPTRGVAIPFPVLTYRTFRHSVKLNTIINRTTENIVRGIPIATPKLESNAIRTKN